MARRRHYIGPQKPSFDLSDKDDSDPVEIPIDGTLDLHTFRPDEVKDLVAEYLGACLVRGMRQVRIIHGKGTGTLRETGRSVLRRCRRSFVQGGWRPTIVIL